jgi:hypothetical protein
MQYKRKWEKKLANGTILSHKGHDTAAKRTFLALQEQHNALKLELNIDDIAENYVTDFVSFCE